MSEKKLLGTKICCEDTVSPRCRSIASPLFVPKVLSLSCPQPLTTGFDNG